MAELPKKRRNNLDLARLARLLDPAEEEFAAHGFSGASLNHILSQAGMSKGQAYYYIAGKADLYEAVIERALQRLITQLDFSFSKSLNAEQFWRRIGEFFARVHQVLVDNTTLAALACSLYENETTRAIFPNKLIQERFVELIKQGRSIGAIRCDLPESLFMNMLFAMAIEADRWFANHWQQLGESESTRLNRQVIAVFRAVAAPPDASMTDHRDIG
ncbi:TetR/AcrR family transcriptional regulator [Celerinatantimonas yamalensis]|uniref:TetR/AcrR family transcriptional regulator n=1 Tax=Celerinatantimonas yamalensis TaxID=559956 RepID=A0ABW9G955_9GAMM